MFNIQEHPTEESASEELKKNIENDILFYYFVNNYRTSDLLASDLKIVE